MKVVRTILFALIAISMIGMSGCLGAGKWVTPAIGGGSDGLAVHQVSVDSYSAMPEPRLAEIPVRKKARFCCAFGTDLQVRLGKLPIPWVKVGRFLNLPELGPHRYDGATAAVDDDRPNAFPGGEHNGMMYTCRGGFIDTAHVRETVDWAAFFVAQLDRHLEVGSVLALGDEGGDRRMIIRAIDPELIAEHGRDQIIIDLSEWMSHQVMAWHEIAQYYGWSVVAIYPEKVSGFSPEDIYSNAVGAELIREIDIKEHLASEKVYNRHIDEIMATKLAELQPVAKEIGEDAVRAVDGVWWTSELRLPDDALVQRRYFDVDTDVEPWLLPDRQATPQLRTQLADTCGENPDPYVVVVPDRIGDVAIDDIITFEVVPESKVAKNEIFRSMGDVVTHRDFPELSLAAQKQNQAEFGLRAHLPD
jgi:hypothetical protein